MHAQRVAQKIADRVEIVDRVQKDFHPRQVGKEGPKVPGRVHRQQPVDIDDLTQLAARDGVFQRQQRGSKAQLEVDGGLQALLAADADDPVGLGQIGPHRFLQDADGTIRQRLKQARMRGGGRGKVIDRAKAKSHRLGHSGKGAGAVFGRHRRRLGMIRVVDARDGEPNRA